MYTHRPPLFIGQLSAKKPAAGICNRLFSLGDVHSAPATNPLQSSLYAGRRLNLPLRPGLLLRLASIKGSDTLPSGEERLQAQKKPTVIYGRLFLLGDVLLSQDPAVQVPSALEGLTVVFGMGTRGSPPPSPPNRCFCGRVTYWMTPAKDPTIAFQSVFAP